MTHHEQILPLLGHERAALVLLRLGDAQVGQVVERVRGRALVGGDEAPPVDAEHRRRVQDLRGNQPVS